MVILRPSEIRYTQDSIGCCFQNGTSLSATIEDIANGRKSVAEIPMIEVYKKNGVYWTRGNRRLYVFKKLEMRGKLSSIDVLYIGERTMHCDRFTSLNNGLSIRVQFRSRLKKFNPAVYEEMHQKLQRQTKPDLFTRSRNRKSSPYWELFLDYTPIRGFKAPYMFELWVKRFQELGDLYKEKLPGDTKYTVFCRTPGDTEKLFRSDSRFPMRQSQEALTFLKAKAGLPDSLFNLNGQEWYKHRKAVNAPLLMKKMVWKYTNQQQEVSRDLVKFISNNLNEKGEVDKFDEMLSRWAFEEAGVFLLNARLGMLDGSPNPEVIEMFRGPMMLTEFMATSFSAIKWWKYINTKWTREAIRVTARTWEIMAKLVEQKQNAGELLGTTLGDILSNQELSTKEKTNLVFDLVGGSVETTSRAAALMIHSLTVKPDVQEKLRNEISKYPEELTGRDLDGMKYLAAFMKESNRLYPLAHIFGRKYSEDIVLSGYRIPAGTNVANTSNTTLNRDPAYFHQPDEFMPERWLADTSANRFNLTGPFGIGTRACPGRRFATQELRLLLVEILKKYKVEYHYKPIVSVFRLIGIPSEEPKFKFIPLGEQS